MEVAVKDRQTLADIAIQVLGSFEAIFNLAVRNSLSITAKLNDGDTLQWDTEDIVNTTVREKYTALGLTPATDIDDTDYSELIAATDEATEEESTATATVTSTSLDESVLSTLDILINAARTGSELPASTTTSISLTRLFEDAFSSTFA